MKKLLGHQVPQFSFSKLLALSVILLSLNFSTKAQTLVPAGAADFRYDLHNHCYACSTDVGVTTATTINADMYDVSGDKLIAIAYTVMDGWKKYETSPVWGPCIGYTGVPEPVTGLHLEFPGIFHLDQDLCIPDAENPDVVIGNDHSFGHGSANGDYLIASVYNSTLNPNDVMMTTWQLSNFVSPVITPTPTAAVAFSGFALNDQANGRIARDPHIDLWADKVDPLHFGTSEHERFIATWWEFDPAPAPGANQYYIMVAVGDLLNPVAFTRYQIATFKGSDGASPDVAAQIAHKFNGSDQHEMAYITYLDPTHGNAIRFAELEFFGNTLMSNVSSALSSPSANTDVNPPRIEAQGYFNLDVRPPYNEAKWDVVVSAIPSGGTNFEIQSFTDITTGKQVIATSSTEDHFSAAVAGVGEDMDMLGFGRVGEINFSTAYYSTEASLSIPSNGDIFANSISMTTGLPSTDYYEVNFSDLKQTGTYGTANEIPVAITSSSNSGDDILVVWFNGFDVLNNWGDIKYKLGGNTYAFKPTSISSKQLEHSIKVYPNPAADVLNVDGAANGEYSITDALGRIVTKGTINANKYSVNTSSYIPGVYTLTVINNGKTEKIKFVKED